MALTYIGHIDILLRTETTLTRDLGSNTIPEKLTFAKRFALNGAYGDSHSVASGVPVTYDLRGGQTDIEGTAINRANIALIAVKNKSTTTGQYITIGAGSTPITTLWGASGDASVVGPDSIALFMSTVDGFATTAATADILTLTAATGTISFDILVWWL